MKRLSFPWWLLVVLGCMSCRTTQECSNQSAPGNCGSFVNSPADDVAPRFINGNLFFTTGRTLTDVQSKGVPSGAKDFVFECSRFDDGNFSAATRTLFLPPAAWGGAGPSVYHENDSVAVAVFTVTSGTGKQVQTDLATSTMTGGVWSVPEILSSCSSTSWEAQPFFSRDGTMLAFCSDRPGGMGGMDIWISTREGSEWSEPRNAGSGVNSLANEITPSFDYTDNLLFATDGVISQGYDIMRATPTQSSAWGQSVALPAPINSRHYDDISPIVYGDSIFFASTRPGGCGGYDLYGMILCGPVLLRGNVVASGTVTRLSGMITVLDSSGRLQQSMVRENGEFEVKLMPRRSYVIRYVNECTNEAIEQRFTAPCNETATVVVKSSLSLPEIPVVPPVSLDQYFFLPGGYRPLSSSALTTLRVQSELNLTGADPLPLRYRSLPASADADAQRIEAAITEMCNSIQREMDWRYRGCGDARTLSITITGYPDDSLRTAQERYDEAAITESEASVRIARGATLDDNTLSLLRAVYMKKVLEEKLRTMLPAHLSMATIKWSMAAGTRNDGNTAAQTRRIAITLR
jgi:hypothetical protein